MNISTRHTDFLIIGSGLAGLYAALHASSFGKVTLLTKDKCSASSSFWAQGGIAAVIDPGDSIASHIRDTLAAGRGLCDTRAVELLIKEGSERVQDLIAMGMQFDKKGDKLELGMEGGHSSRRILHANGVTTGKAMIEFILTLLKKKENVTLVEHAFVYDLITGQGSCLGVRAYLYNNHEQVQWVSPSTILATGGYSGLYLRTTNPHTSTGDGLWLAAAAGARLRDLEFVQFHPTAFHKPDGTTLLISEALRGEGAHLLNAQNKRFMEKYDQKELAPRDTVSKEIYRQILSGPDDFVYLDMRHISPAVLLHRFGELHKRLLELGMDMIREKIPVAPAAHYCIGGISTGFYGETTVPGLYACGEAASAGVHGANRLASNSLLECLVFSKRAADHAVGSVLPARMPDPELQPLRVESRNSSEFHSVKHETAILLNQYAGIERHKKGLTTALDSLNRIQNEFRGEPGEYYSIRTNGLLNIAMQITLAALERTESLGVHYRTDHPQNTEGPSSLYA